MATPQLTIEQDAEVTFMTGVTSTGVVAAKSFWAWNDDKPASYDPTTSFAAKWGTPVAGTAGGVITYTFDNASAWTSTEKSAFASTLALWSAVANVTFQQVSSGGNVIIQRISGTTDSNGGITRLFEGDIGTTNLGRATQSGISINTSLYGEGPLGSGFSNFGGYPWEVLLHEEGHVLGLGHAGPYNGTVDPTTQQYTTYDAREWSIMSYIDPFTSGQTYQASEPVLANDWGVSRSSDGTLSYNGPTTWMPLDILAIQRLYGLPTSTPLSGGQTFGFNCNIAGPIESFFDFTMNTKPIITLWDEGTGNTLDLSGYTTSSVVSLMPGVFGSCGGLTHNIVIAFGVQIDTLLGGSGGDTLIANDDGDTLSGGGGSDILIAGLGHDTLSGGAESNRFQGTKAQLNGDSITDFTTIDQIFVIGASGSDGFALNGQSVVWSTGSISLGASFNGYLSVQPTPGVVWISIQPGSTTISKLADGSSLINGYNSQGVLQSQADFDASGHEVYYNAYDTGLVSKQYGYAASGTVITEIDYGEGRSFTHTSWTSAGVIVSEMAYTGSNVEIWANFYDATGLLIEQDGFTTGIKTIEIDHGADGGTVQDAWTGAGVLISQKGFSAAGQEIWANFFDATGELVEQDGFTVGVKTIEIDHAADGGTVRTLWTGAGALTTQMGFTSGGTEIWANFYDGSGRLFEQDGFSTNGVKTIQIDQAADGSYIQTDWTSSGVEARQRGFAADGHETFANLFDDAGRLVEQDGFAQKGAKVLEIDHAADGTSLQITWTDTGVLASLTGYGANGNPSYQNLYDGSGRLVQQNGFAADGAKTIEIDHAADGSTTTSNFTNGALTSEVMRDSTGALLETLSRNPSNGVYTLNGAVGYVELDAIAGTGTLTAAGQGTTFGFGVGFGSATIANFTAAGSVHDLIKLDHGLVSDYSHLIAEAQNAGSDLIINFNTHDHLTLHGVQVAQLSSADFVFV